MSCPACGLPGDGQGPTHAYMSSSPDCWALYGTIMAREYSDRAYWGPHRRLVDAYAGQHSIGEDRRARQSLWMHMAGLMLHFEDDWPDDRIVDFLRRAARSEDFAPLVMPEASLGLTVEAVAAAPDPETHAKEVARYARAVFDAWSPHHAAFRGLIQRVTA